MKKGQSARERHRGLFWRRTFTHAGIAAGIIGISLGVGIWGYEHYEHMPWRDAFLNAAMLLAAWGP